MSDTTPGTPNCMSERAAGATVQTLANWKFSNWPGNLEFASPLYFNPRTRAELANAILQAESAGHHVRAFGSKWSFSDAVHATKGNPPQHGAMIDTEQLNSPLDSNLRYILAAGIDPTFLFHVEAGIKCDKLIERLAQRGQALPAGGASGQSLAGLISTSTHSADSLVAPLVDYVQAIHLVGSGGVEHWIERDTGITDPAKLQAIYSCLAAGNIHYNTKLFNAVLVSAGSMGVIYSVILETVPQYGLHQHRVATTWEDLLQVDPDLAKAIDGTYMESRNSVPPQIDILDAPITMTGPFTQNRFSQIVISPYPFYSNDDTLTTQEELRVGHHLCFVTNHVKIQVPTNPHNPQSPDNFQTIGAGMGQAARKAVGGGPGGIDAIIRFATFVSSLQSEPSETKKAAALIDFLAGHFAPGTISAAIHFLLEKILPVGDRWEVSSKLAEVLTWSANERIDSVCVEAAFTVPDALAYVSQVLALVESYANRVKPDRVGGSYIGGYLSLRFVGQKTGALLGMQRWSPTCCVEYLGLAGTRDVNEFVNELQARALANRGVLHWGLQNNVMTFADIRKAYGHANIEEFRRARGIVSQSGKLPNLNGTFPTFDNTFTDRLELSALNGLAFIDGSSDVTLHVWHPGQLVEGHPKRTEIIMLYNHLDGTVQVSDVRITSSKDAQGAPVFNVLYSRRFRVDALDFHMIVVDYTGTGGPGLLTGTVEVDCDDPMEPTLRLPLSTSVIPLGDYAKLEFDPTSLDFGNTLVATTQTRIIDVTNVGSYAASIRCALTFEQPVGQFQIPFDQVVSPHEYKSLEVSYIPTTRGAARGTLVINMTSQTDAGVGYEYEHSYEIPLAGTATSPTIFLAPGPQQWTDPIPFPGHPDSPRLPIPQIELKELDFGFAAPSQTSAASFWIRNVGDAPLLVQGVVVNSMSSFGLRDRSIFPATLQPGTEMEVPCSFLALPGPGRITAGVFHVGSDDPLRLYGGNPPLPGAVLQLKGRTAGPHLTQLGGEVLNFGTVPYGPTSATIIFLSDGTDPVTLRSVRLATGTDFSVSGARPRMGAELAPGTELTLTVTLTATQPGHYQDQLFLEHGRDLIQQSQVNVLGNVQ